MAESEDLIIRLRADVADLSDGLKEAAGKMSEFSATTVAKGIIIADAFKVMGRATLSFLKDSVQAYGESESAITKLSLAVGSKAVPALTAYAAQIQKTTSFNDESVVALQTQLAQFGVMPEAINDATGALVDYAAATGKDLPSAATVLGQAMAGNARELKRYGIEIRETDTRTQRLEKATDGLRKLFGGMAEEMGNTQVGNFNRMKNALGEVKEQVGRLFSPAMQTFAKNFSNTMFELADVLSRFSTIGGTLKVFLLEILQQGFIKAYLALRPFIVTWNQFVAASGKIGAAMGLSKVNTDKMALSVVKLTQKWQNEIMVNEKSGKSHRKVERQNQIDIAETTDKVQERIDLLKQEIYVAERSQNRISEINALESQKRVLMAQQSFAATATFSQALAIQMAESAVSWGTVWADVIMNIREQFASGIADMILEGRQFHDVMKSIGEMIIRSFIENVVKRMVTEFMIGLGIMQAGYASMGAGGFGAGGGFVNYGGMAAGGSELVGQSTGQTVAGIGAVGTGVPAGGGMFARIGPGLGVAGGLLATGLISGGFKKDTDRQNAQIGGTIGTTVGSIWGPLGSVVGGAAGAFIGGNARGIGRGFSRTIGRKVKNIFSGGIVGEPGVLITDSGEMARVGEDGPEALISFRDRGLTPKMAASAVMNGNASGGLMMQGGGGITININGTFIEGEPAKWQRLLREMVIPEIQRATMIRPKGAFNRRRGQAL